MSDQTIKAIKGINNTKNLIKKKLKHIKSYGKELLDGLTDIYIREDPAFKVIIDFRTPTETGFRSEFGFKQNGLIMIEEQSVLTRIMKTFASEKVLQQNYVLSYRINLYFPEQKLAIEVDEKKTHTDRDEYEEFARENGIKESFDCKIIRINPDKNDQ